MRFIGPQGEIDLSNKSNEPTPGYTPWFKHPMRNTQQQNILFGHWSTLGAYDAPGIHALDTGCLWGGELTAFRLGKKKPKRIEYNCKEFRRPKSKK